MGECWGLDLGEGLPRVELVVELFGMEVGATSVQVSDPVEVVKLNKVVDIASAPVACRP